MSFDFFNVSHLAFGSKLTAAFKQLEKLKNEAELNLNNVLMVQDIYKEYNARNYQIPVPSGLDSPCRVDEVFQVIDAPFIIKKMEYTGGKLYVDILTFNSTTLRITCASGSTDLKEGSAYYDQSISNLVTGRDIKFVSKSKAETGTKLFDFRIDNNGYICLENISEYIEPLDYNHYSSLSNGGNVSFPYTATDYECIVAVGNDINAEIKLNGTTILGYWDARNCKRFVVVYMKAGDVLTGSAQLAFKVKYNIK